MKSTLMFSAFLLICLSVCSQSRIPDKKYKKLPVVAQSPEDSIYMVDVYVNVFWAFKEKPMKDSGIMHKRITYLPNLLPKSIEVYDRMGKEVRERYDYGYKTDDEYTVSYEGAHRTYYSWKVKNSVVQESTYSKRHKEWVDSRWTFEYKEDTLMTSCIKYYGDTVVAYEVVEDWSETNRKLSRSVSDGKQTSELTRYLYSFQDADSAELINPMDDGVYNSSNTLQVADSSAVLAQKDRVVKSLNKVFKYTETGLLDRLEIHNHKGKLKETYHFKFDQNRRLIYVSGFKGKREIARYEYSYDEYGNRIDHFIYENKWGYFKMVYALRNTYNKKGLLSQLDYINYVKGHNFRWIYEYTYF